ncbi:hydrolase [Saccharospirillum salsuginis]|uniref:Hydrolase n=2 Tax=Saccharospirillum salsuginis TaxID=418750 RepID=A0A918K0X1_9GAMM|nr:hydrolase [Saccharospirillum salsuginis]
MLLQEALGSDTYHVVEEGLPGRTTVWNDPFDGATRNGVHFLPIALESHQPDMVILLLGTNDLKSRFALSAYDISMGVKACAEVVLTFQLSLTNKSPEVLLIAPPPIVEAGTEAGSFQGSQGKSRKIGLEYQKRAQELGCKFLDAGRLVKSDPSEGIHWDSLQHRTLAEGVIPFI